jgi:hypothetical protein
MENFITPETTTEEAPKPQWLRVILGTLVLFTGLCTIFALAVTALEAWQEHAQEQWPQAMARVEKCSVEPRSTGRRNMFHIRCRLSYDVDGQRNVASVYSRNAPSADVWQYPPNQIAPFELWVEQHPEGTVIAVRYDPSNHSKAVLVATNMPGGRPHTPGNIKLLELCAGSFVILLMIMQMTRPNRMSQTDL